MRTSPPSLVYSLRVFALAARDLSFKTAAQALFLTPSAVSHRIRDLERHLGQRLFDRKTRSIVLTATGAALLRDIEPLLSGLDGAVERLSQRSARRALRVTAPPFFTSEMFMPALRSFYGLQPRIDVLVRSDVEQPTEHLRPADVSILILASAPADMVSTKLFAPRFIAVASRPVAAVARELGRRMLDRQRLIVYRPRAELWRRFAAAAALAPPAHSQVIEVDSAHAGLSAAEQGLGIALAPAVMSERWLRTGRLVRVSDVDVDTDDAYFLTYRITDRSRPDVRAFVSWAITEFRRD